MQDQMGKFVRDVHLATKGSIFVACQKHVWALVDIRPRALAVDLCRAYLINSNDYACVLRDKHHVRNRAFAQSPMRPHLRRDALEFRFVQPKIVTGGHEGRDIDIRELEQILESERNML